MRAGDLVCLVHLVYPVCLIQLKNKTNQTNQLNETDQIDSNRPNEQDRLAVLFSTLLLRKCELGHFRLVETLLHQRAHIEHPFDLLNVLESGFRAGVRWGEE